MHVVAYIDAGTGSYLLAAIASGVAGAWFFFHAQIAKIRRKLTGKSAEVVEVETDELDGEQIEEVVLEVEQADPQSLEK
jgi:hypothetical protein